MSAIRPARLDFTGKGESATISSGKVKLPMLRQGADYVFEVVLFQSAGQVANDLTGVSFRGHFRRRKRPRLEPSASEPVTELDFVVTDAPNGLVRLRIPATETDAMDFFSGVYDIEAVYQDFGPAFGGEEHVVRVAEGRWRMSPQATVEAVA